MKEVFAGNNGNKKQITYSNKQKRVSSESEASSQIIVTEDENESDEDLSEDNSDVNNEEGLTSFDNYEIKSLNEKAFSS